MEFTNTTTEKQGLPVVGRLPRAPRRKSAETQLNSIFDDVNVIGGGQENTISAGAQHSFIGGGINNVVNANCGAILGGENNTVNHAYAAVFGNGITSVATDTFHVSCLNAVNSPVYGGVLPVGTLAYVNATPGMVAVGFPVGSKIAMIV